MGNEKRLIDANELWKVLKNEECDCEVFLWALHNAPTVDAVEVVHGRWVKRSNEMKCSVCKFIYYSNNDHFNYCPNCGAKMDGERSK